MGMAALHAVSEQPGQARELFGEALGLGSDAALAEAGGYPVLAELLEKASAPPRP